MKALAELGSILALVALMALNFGITSARVDDLRQEQEFMRTIYEQHRRDFEGLVKEIAALRVEVHNLRRTLEREEARHAGSDR